MKAGMFESYREALGFLIAATFGWLILTAFIFTGIGYAWAWHHGNIQLERAYNKGYEAAVEELMVVVKEDVCK